MVVVPVLIVGGGPVGLTLALCLATRGIRCMLVERNTSTTAHPKMDMTNSRTMELFRRLGMAELLRKVAVPEDHPLDVLWLTSMTGYELHRFPYPSIIEWRALIRAQNNGSQPLEPPMRVSQVEIEPVLRMVNEQHELVDIHYGVAIEDLEQDGEGVTAKLKAQSGTMQTVRCRYLIGCDGGGSLVRERVGINVSGRWRILPRYTAHFRSDAAVLRRWGPAWHFQSNRGTLVSQNGTDVWSLHARFPEGVANDDVDPSALIEAFVGEPFLHQILLANAWSPHLVVADRYSQGRVFLAGDAVHQYSPTGGYGMNTGIADAYDLAWKLAATLRGFGGPTLLASYEVERRPVALRNREASGRHNDVRGQIARLFEPEIGSDAPAGSVARVRARAGIIALGNAENESRGLEYGYSYVDSPIICGERGIAAPSDPVQYVPSTVPGTRLPSVFLADGSALFDRLGPWLTLLAFDDSTAEAMSKAAERRDVPLAVLRIRERELVEIYEAPAVLVRPDQHVAWRGALPRDEDAAAQILDRVLGWDAHSRTTAL
jgi:2-polyprenyl-6-methoxyphenol hydroxylase-like FAD-dependent oxidoreductase